MEAAGLVQGAERLPGRDQECAEIDRALERAAGGESSSLLIRGQPGIGKTALLRYAAERAEGMTVLSVAGVEAESDLAFAGLYGLLRPILHRLDQIPEAHSAALAGALGLGPSSGADRFLVSAAVLDVLAAAGEEQPLLCLIDDAQWLDGATAFALVFAARRLQADSVAMLFGVREDEGPKFEARGLPELTVRGVDGVAATAILAEHALHAAPSVAERLLAEAQGNPLALIELPAALSEAQLAGAERLPETIPLTPRLQQVFGEQIARLPEPTQAALLIAAAEETGELPTVLRAAAELGLSSETLAPAEQANLITVTGGAILFRHPLVRSTLQETATTAQRQRVHAALAAALSAEEHADRRVWHQAMATLTADEEVAAALEASARRAQLRAANCSAATALFRAAEISGDETRRLRRIAAAAQAAWDAGEYDRVRDALARSLPTATGEERALLLHLAGVLEERTGSLRDAHAILLDGADLTQDPSLELEMLFDAAEAAIYCGELQSVANLHDRVAQVPASTKRDRLRRGVLLGYACVFAGRHEEADALFAEAVALAEAIDDPRTLLWAADAASVGNDLGAGLSYTTRAVDLARQQGRLSLLQLALRRHAGELLWNSQFDLAYAAAQEGYSLALAAGYSVAGHLANLALVEAIWGRAEEARCHAEEALALGQRHGSAFLVVIAEWTLGLIALMEGRPEEAADRLLAVTSPERPDFNPSICLPAIPDAVELAIRVGRRPEALERLDAFRAWVDAASTEKRRALLARCQALVSERDPDEAFVEAIRMGSGLAPFQRARGELLYGEWLRRERRRKDARSHLRTALELFRGMGAAPWEERAADELRATGETARRRDPSTLDHLTPQELQIAQLVATGLTNRAIAAQLFLSPRTVDYHLRKVFAKLGIASRAELIRHGLSREAT